MKRRAMAGKTTLSADDQSLKDQRAASLSLMLLAMVGGATYASSAQAEIGYGGPTNFLTITPEESSVQEGSPVVADVAFSGLQDQLIGSYDMTIAWNPTLLSFDSINYGVFLDAPDSIQGFFPATGSLEVFEVSLGSLSNQSGFGTIPLFSVTFDSIGTGTSPLSFDTSANGGITIVDQTVNAFTNFFTVDSSVDINGAASPPPTMEAPEMDVTSAGSALTLLVGGILVLSSRRTTNVARDRASKF
jgi:hypothetical protein